MKQVAQCKPTNIRGLHTKSSCLAFVLPKALITNQLFSVVCWLTIQIIYTMEGIMEVQIKDQRIHC